MPSASEYDDEVLEAMARDILKLMSTSAGAGRCLAYKIGRCTTSDNQRLPLPLPESVVPLNFFPGQRDRRG